jgi:hypothetical protein
MRRIVPIVLLLVLIAGVAAAAEKAFIRDIQADPAKYLNIPVQLRGEVTQVTVTEQPTRGSYTLRDDSDRTITVRSRELPAPGHSIVVEGLLTQEAGVTTYYVRELSRCEPSLFSLCGGWDWWTLAVIGAAVLVAGLVVLLVVLLMRPGAQATVSLPGGAAAAVPEKTRAVSTEEMRKMAPAPQSTVRLPVVPAQIEVLSGAKSGTRHVLKQETAIGRANGDLALEDPTVSSEHAKIQFENPNYRLINRSLTNPTMVNGNRIEGVVDLKDGDELVMGGVKMRFTLMK